MCLQFIEEYSMIETVIGMRTLEIGKNDAGQRLDKFLQKRFKTMPKIMMKVEWVIRKHIVEEE